VFNLVRGKEVNVICGYGISGVLYIDLRGSEQRAGGNVSTEERGINRTCMFCGLFAIYYCRQIMDRMDAK
jgi:hypothetical protein